MEADELFDPLVSILLADPQISTTKMFGARGLRVGKKVFACLYKGKLVLKLPKQRVDELVQAGKGENFDPGMGRPSKEWIALGSHCAAEWPVLVQQARDFVALNQQVVLAQ